MKVAILGSSGQIGAYLTQYLTEKGHLVREFDVTKNAWHGLPENIKCPKGVSRNSLAIYYLQEPDKLASDKRLKAQFVPADWQKEDPKVKQLCKDRASLDKSSQVYIDN